MDVVRYDVYSYLSQKEIAIGEVERVNGLVAAHIQKDVEAVVHKAQHELKSDISGFGEKIYRKYPQFWLENRDNWSELFSTMDVKVDVEAKLRDTGELANSFLYHTGKD